MRSHGVLILLSLLGPVLASADDAVVITIDMQAERRAISPLVYGSNSEVTGHVFRAARRLGGNRLTTYNWEIDASNAGKDFRHNSDHWLASQEWWTASEDGEPPVKAGTPAGTVIRFHRESLVRGAYSLVTVPFSGHVVGDADGPILEDESAPSGRWVETRATSKSPGRWSKNDKAVYADQMVTHLVKTLGAASSDSGIPGYSLDNEPSLWHDTHPRLRQTHVTCSELMERSIDTARAIKSVDAEAEVFGPALWGIASYVSLWGAEDWPTLRKSKKDKGYEWFIDFYLDQMHQASQESGVRLLDVLDVHWYTEAPDGREWTGLEAARAAKALYDPHHVEQNWVGENFSRFLPILPKLQESIDRFYPGTRIAITEYDWPMTGTIYGGLAQADALGAFGRYGVYFAAYHHYAFEKPDRYVGAAFALYRNYDGRGASFGNKALPLSVEGGENIEAYASVTEADGGDDATQVHVVVINREPTKTSQVRFCLSGDVTPTHAASWFFDDSDSAVRSGKPPVIILTTGDVVMTLPPLSAWHAVLTLPEK